VGAGIRQPGAHRMQAALLLLPNPLDKAGDKPSGQSRQFTDRTNAIRHALKERSGNLMKTADGPDLTKRTRARVRDC